MSNSLSSAFAKAKSENRAVLIGYIPAGFPTQRAAKKIVKAMIAESKVRHRGERTLAEHICRAVQIKTSDGVLISSARSPGPIELARCAVLAIAKASRPRVVGKPMLVITGT